MTTSIAITTTTAAKTHQAVDVSIATHPARRATASAPTATLTRRSTNASANAARCSALPWPYGWPRSAGRPATPIAKYVSNAATRSVPECSASETRPRLPLARPVTSLIAISAVAAPTDTSAIRRCGVIAAAYWASPSSISRRNGRTATRCQDAGADQQPADHLECGDRLASNTTAKRPRRTAADWSPASRATRRCGRVTGTRGCS